MLKRKKNDFFAFRIGALAMVLAVCFVLGSFAKSSLAAWSEPLASPPGGNVLPPIWNQNSTSQTGNFRISGTGTFGTSLGIGVTEPATAAQIYNATSGPILTMSGLDSNYRGVTIKDIADTEKWFFGNDSSNKYVIRRDGATNDIIVNSSGNVGIGNSSPVALLTVGAAGRLGSISMAGNTSGAITIRPQAAAGTYNLTLPNALPGTSGFALVSDTSGNMSWAAAGGGGAAQTPWTSNINADGYTLYGNDTASGNMTIDSTPNATKGYVLLNPTGGNVGIGNSAPGQRLTVGAVGRSGTLGLAGSTSGVVTVQPAAAAGTWTLTLPTTDGDNGQALTTNGSGVTSWTTIAAGSQTPWTSDINAAGYTLQGNSTASGNMTIDSTSNATKGYVLLNPSGGNVGIGTIAPGYALDVNGTINGLSAAASGVQGTSTSSYGVYGTSPSGVGIGGVSTSGYGVYGSSSSSYAGYFNGTLNATGTITQNGVAVCLSDGTNCSGSSSSSSPGYGHWVPHQAPAGWAYAGSGSFYSSAYGLGRYVVAGVTNNVEWSSTDGLNWTQSAFPGNPEYMYHGGEGGGIRFIALPYNSGSTGNNTLQVSVDGLSWTPCVIPGTARIWRSVTYGNGKFVAVGNDTNGYLYVSTSVDGCTWTSNAYGGLRIAPRALVFVNGYYNVVGENWSNTTYNYLQSAYSTDGTSWTSIAGNLSSCTRSCSFVVRAAVSPNVAIFTYRLVTGSWGSDTYRTVNGTAWTSLGNISGWYQTDIAYSGGNFYIITRSGYAGGADGDYLWDIMPAQMLSSVDGVLWSIEEMPTAGGTPDNIWNIIGGGQFPIATNINGKNGGMSVRQ